jgi:hypothetical protein
VVDQGSFQKVLRGWEHHASRVFRHGDKSLNI